MRALSQVRQAVVWGCVGLFSSCPFFDPRSNNAPLQYGMTVEAAATALEVPLAYVSGRNGSEIYYAERSAGMPAFYTYDRSLWLQFRRGRLTGWHNDWQRTGLW